MTRVRLGNECKQPNLKGDFAEIIIKLRINY